MAALAEMIFNEHQPDKCLAESDAIADQSPTSLFGYVTGRAIAVLLVEAQRLIHNRLIEFPIYEGRFAPGEILIESFCPYSKRRKDAQVTLDQFEDFGIHLFGVFPYFLIPVFKGAYLA